VDASAPFAPEAPTQLASLSIDGAGADVLRPRGRVREASGDVGP